MSLAQILTIGVSLFVCNSVLSQEYEDWPYDYLWYPTTVSNTTSARLCNGEQVKYSEVVNKRVGREYYCSGNLHAEGPLLSMGSIISIDTNNMEHLETSYKREGLWKVYFDSSSPVVRSEGYYKNGKRDGNWNIYSRNGQLRYEFNYVNDLIKRKNYIDDQGNRQTLISLNDGNIFVLKHKALLIFLLIAFTLFRSGVNRVTYNKIHNTKYLPGIYKFDPDNNWINFMCIFIFWWPYKISESQLLKKYKRRATLISIFSSAFVLVIIFLFIRFGG
jgi:hypothetical protein